MVKKNIVKFNVGFQIFLILRISVIYFQANVLGLFLKIKDVYKLIEDIFSYVMVEL